MLTKIYLKRSSNIKDNSYSYELDKQQKNYYSNGNCLQFIRYISVYHSQARLFHYCNEAEFF